jgi:hypothetical protein
MDFGKPGDHYPGSVDRFSGAGRCTGHARLEREELNPVAGVDLRLQYVACEMKAQLYGSNQRPVKAVIGSWEPLMPNHIQLFDTLVQSAHQDGCGACVVLIDPPPAQLVWKATRVYPEYDDLKTRLFLIAACAVDAILVVDFREADLNATAEEFLAVVQSHVTLGELWLGKTQTLGRGPEGSQIFVRELAKTHGFKLRVLPSPQGTINPHTVLQHVSGGKLVQASALVGRPPVRSRPESGIVYFHWPPGCYAALPLAEPAFGLSPPLPETIKVELISNLNGSTSLHWPSSDVEWLALVADVIPPE